MNNMRSH